MKHVLVGTSIRSRGAAVNIVSCTVHRAPCTVQYEYGALVGVSVSLAVHGCSCCMAAAVLLRANVTLRAGYRAIGCGFKFYLHFVYIYLFYRIPYLLVQ